MRRTGGTSREADKVYQVLIDDNYHFMDEDERTTGPTFATYGEAVAWCQTYLERHLQELLKPGMSAGDLVAGYKSFGDDPWITPEPEGTHFSAWDFVEQIAGRVCATAAVCKPPAVETVLEVLAEGGSLTVVRSLSKAGTWQFWVTTDEGTLLDFLTEQDRLGLGDGITHYGPAATFENALVLLDRYPWTDMHPDRIHPDFRSAVWAAVQARSEALASDDDPWRRHWWDEWRRICLGPGAEEARGPAH